MENEFATLTSLNSLLENKLEYFIITLIKMHIFCHNLSFLYLQ